ncbi:MAG: recombinase family protein [Blautia sp.]|nr:recombinase family protein [Blautia sp.]
MSIKVIPVSSNSEYEKVLRVGCYCRVSTDLAAQESSFASQQSYYKALISEHPGWILQDIYADEGISGTGTEKRSEFKRMIADCEEGKLDLIITKSISRWARNTVDSIQFIRKLKALGISVIFQKENINTMDASGEVLLTILASLAQQESESISKNVSMGIRMGFKQGKFLVNHNQFLGYTRIDGQLMIVPEQAVTVRRIFREYLDGSSPSVIAKGLEEDGARTGTGKTKWYESGVRVILENEKYKGDVLMQKTYVADVLSKRIVKNHGELEQYYVDDDHEPIVPKEVFDLAQKVKRQIQYANPLIGRIICCGEQVMKKRADIWRCPYCGKIVKDEQIKENVVLAMNRLTEKRALIDSLTIPGNTPMAIRNLRELTAALAGEKWESLNGQEGNRTNTEALHLRGKRAACRDAEDFYSLTNPETVYGPVRQFQERRVGRYLEKIVIMNDKVLVQCKVGVDVSIH